MSGSSPGSPGKKSSGQRLSLGPQPAPGRLGRLSKGVGPSGGTSQGASAASSSSAAMPAADGPAGPKPRRRFQPTVPVRKKKAAPVAAADAADLGMDSKDFLAMVSQADADNAFDKKGGRGRGRGRGRDPRLSQQPAFGPGAPGAKVHVKTETTEKSENGDAPTTTSHPTGKGRLAKARAGSAQEANLASAMKESLPEDKSYTDASDDEKEQGGPMLNYDQYYPTMLPMRQPGMEEGFEAEDMQAGARVQEFTTEREEQYVCSTAEALGLPHGADDAEQILLFQMPGMLPMYKRPGPPPDPGPRGALAASASANSNDATPFAELPKGKVGKLLVFKSGAVKLRMGGVLLDIAPGAPCEFRQDVAAFNPSVDHACILGQITQRVVCSPNVEQLLGGQNIPQWKHAPQEAAGKADPDDGETEQAPGRATSNLPNGGPVSIKPEPMDEDGPISSNPGRRKAIIDDDEED
ncbi:hypothetical protein WJX74_009848 [Apatococcus lobatus]|uniref:DNA-directed RNA polymerase III subunit RPC4 n=1 Tax=Apatococcus lobatus TaxID=904363 RepID=A0AAW1RCH4_9CHLO